MTDRFIEGFVLGAWQANCYILGDREAGTAVVIDPGQGGDVAVPERLEANGVRCEAIWCTHGHLDHVWSAPDLARRFEVPVWLHPDDRWLWDDPAAAFGDLPPGALEAQLGFAWDPAGVEVLDLADDQHLNIAGMDVVVRHAPGHTPGEVVLVTFDLGDDPVMVSGDLLFAGSVGRTDFPRSSHATQQDSLRRVVLPCADRTVVLSGHGAGTTVGTERATNPFLAELS